MPVRYILSSVWVRLSIFSQLSIIQYMGLCVFSLPISLVMIEMIYTLSYHHHQIGRMNYYPLFRVRSWNNGMRLMSLYILTDTVSGSVMLNSKPCLLNYILQPCYCSYRWINFVAHNTSFNVIPRLISLKPVSLMAKNSCALPIVGLHCTDKGPTKGGI